MPHQLEHLQTKLADLTVLVSELTDEVLRLTAASSVEVTLPDRSVDAGEKENVAEETPPKIKFKRTAAQRWLGVYPDFEPAKPVSE